MAIKYERTSAVSFNIFDSDTRIVLNLLSFTGIPNIQAHPSQNEFSKFRKLVQYILFIYLFCIFLGQEYERLNKFIYITNNLAVGLNITSTSVLSLLLKLFFLKKVKHLNLVVESLWKFILRYEVSYVSQRKTIITGCIVCLILPVLICLCHTFIESSSGLQKWINLLYFSNNESWAVITLCLLDIGKSINEYTFPLVTTILFSFIYISYFTVALKPLTDQLKKNS